MSVRIIDSLPLYSDDTIKFYFIHFILCFDQETMIDRFLIDKSDA